MKQIIYILTVILITSCGSKKTAIVAAQTTVKEIETPTDNNSTEISLVTDGTIDDNGISETVELVAIEKFDHSIFNKLLKKLVTQNGLVSYKGFKNNAKTLRDYIALLSKYTPTENWTKADKLAYWINAYNALTIDLIIRNYPLKTIKDIKNPWDQRLWKFGDKWINLNDIEHKVLRKMDEPRIHFAIVCASFSCPKLQNKAFTAFNLDEQLTNATKEFLSDSNRNKISTNNIEISKIFQWFSKDFKQNGDVINFLNQYSEIEISSKAKKSYMTYNWDLNE
ncbi:DUF547 domain-containing protein [Aurantibacter sp.]|uniref:DUF547 domain-containing protein n=1 Tax=Aurantibacter sp. TaxID=2807103 RepID=UPI0035C84647